MANKNVPRNSYRDRHDRGIRRPLMSKLFKFGESRNHSFKSYVDNAMEYLKGLWPEELSSVRWSVVDAPNLPKYATEVPRWRVDREKETVVIYRLPTERLGGQQRSGADERFRVEEQVFEAVAYLLEVDPWDLVPEHYRR